MRRPKRLFRGSALSTRTASAALRPTVLVGLAVAILAVMATLTGLSGDLFGEAPAASGTVSAEPRSVAVVDGETLRLHETVIRLEGVAAPRRGVACRATDGAIYDCGNAAAEALGRVISGRAVACRIDGRDTHGLPQGQCDAGGTRINRAIIAAGWARAQAGSGGETATDGLADEEQRARAAMRGVWRDISNPSF